MPPKTNIKLGESTLYIKGTEGMEPIGEIKDAETLEPGTDLNDIEQPGIYKVNAFSEEVTLALQMTAEAARKMIDAFLGITPAVLGLCGDRRVVHLSLHAKKERTRKKNRRRAYRLLEKEVQLHEPDQATI